MEDFILQQLYKQNKIQQRLVKTLEAKIKSQAHHIELLNQCDDSSTEVIAKMDDEIKSLERRMANLNDVIECQKETIRNQGGGCEERHNVLCAVKEVIDEYFGDV